MLIGLLLVTNATSVPNSLSEKLDYQILQTRLLTGILEDNRLALKRLESMMSYLLDNNDRSQVNESMHHTNSIDEDKQRVQTVEHLHHSKSKPLLISSRNELGPMGSGEHP